MIANLLHRHPVPQPQQSEDRTVLERQTRAQRWLEASIAVWEEEQRVTPAEATMLRQKLAEPTVLAVLPHFGVHLAIGAVLRFPFGSITRAAYTLLQFLLASLRLLVRNIDRRAWRQAMSIHSPLVILCACLPGFGTFAYLASKPFRTNHLLLRVGLDAVLLKLPFHVYERTGFRWVIARPRATVVAATRRKSSLDAGIWAPDLVLILGCIVVALAAADFLVQTFSALGLIDTTALGWNQIARILDLDAESSFGTWFTAVMFVLLAALLAGISYTKRLTGDRFTRHWLILAVLMMGFSIDEIAKLHDSGGNGWVELRDRWGLHGPLNHTWVVFGTISVLIVTWYYRRFITALPSATRGLYIFAATLFVAGEVIVEMFTGWYYDSTGEHDFIYNTMTTVEETLSIAGIFVAVAATLHYIQTSFSEIHISLSDGVQHLQAEDSPPLDPAADSNPTQATPEAVAATAPPLTAV